MTMTDLIDIYQFGYISTTFRTDIDKKLCGCCSMVEEMNKILKAYNSNTAIGDVIRECVCNRHGHQYCISGNAVNKAVDALLRSNVLLANIQQCKPFIHNNKFAKGFADFEELYDFVYSVIGDINGIGPLTTYDTAKRIGHLLSPAIYPK